MRRPVIALVLLVGGVATTTQLAATGSSVLPSQTTAGYRAATVSGATAVSISNTVVAGKITAVTARLRGTTLLTSTVRARFGADSAVTCTAGPITVLNTLTGLGEADYTCTGFLEDASRPRSLLLTAS